MVQKNNWTDYLKYALGEIALVVIGILIALYINNWNEQRKNKDANRVLLGELHRENKINLKSLREDLVYRDTLYTTIYDFHEYLSIPNNTIEPDSLVKYLMALLRLSTYEGNNKYLSKYIDFNSENQSMLADELIRLDDRQRALKIISNKALDLRFEKFFDHIAKEVDFMNLEMESVDIFESLEFRNNLFLLASIEEGVYDAFKASIEQHEKIDSLISITLTRE